MGYQALLFCPDEKLARVVSQVFTELDFTIEPVHEPFAAVKKLMARRYDAIVVDCENEQNASLLFKSARNSSSNQSSLAIAVVEGQAGVAKAYRIGANLVLTKPINVEQAKGTLRVARGLLRKNSDGAAAAGASAATVTPPATAPRTTSVSSGAASSSLQQASRTTATAPPPSISEAPVFETQSPAALPAMSASTRVEDRVEDKPAVVSPLAVQTQTAAAPSGETRQQPFPSIVRNNVVGNDIIKNDAANIGATSVQGQIPSSMFASATGSAAAPAPAKEMPVAPTTENRTLAPAPASSSDVNSFQFSSSQTSSSQTSSLHSTPSHDAAPMFGSLGVTDAPSFGGLDDEDSDGSGGKKKILIAAVAVLALAALGYLGYGKSGKSTATQVPQPVSAPLGSQPTATVSPMSTPVETPSTRATGRASSAAQTSAPKTTTATPLDKPSAGPGNSPVIRIAADGPANSEPATKKASSAPIVVKSNSTGTKAQNQADDAPPLPSTIAVASANDGKLSGLMSSAAPSIPKPSLTTLRISQGVSQGLVIKRVQPKYPPAALAVRTQGTVQIEATINKEGSVVNPKVLSGDPILAHAAIEAVRQWRYKPYYLDGEPVEIQTQITINFKAN
jgi:TonB family protein